jgi:hypothetical protein
MVDLRRNHIRFGNQGSQLAEEDQFSLFKFGNLKS